MAKKKRPHADRSPHRSSPNSGVGLRQLAAGEGWALTHPRCARDRSEDIEEVRAMIEAEEYEIATDELRWLLSGCPEFIEGHMLAGRIALAAHNDLPLARGHFGHAWQLGLKPWRAAQRPTPVAAEHPANTAWHEAGVGLAYTLEKLSMAALADEVVATLRQLDPADPLGAAALLDELRSGGLPMLEL